MERVWRCAREGHGVNSFWVYGRDSSVVLAWVQILRSHVKRQMWRFTPVIPALGVGVGGLEVEAGRSPKLTGHSRFSKRADDKNKG